MLEENRSFEEAAQMAESRRASSPFCEESLRREKILRVGPRLSEGTPAGYGYFVRARDRWIESDEGN